MRSNSIRILPETVIATISPTPIAKSVADFSFSERTTFFFPNPSRDGHLTLSWNLPSPQNVSLKIFDIAGTLVYSQTIGSGQTQKGINQISWNGVNQGGDRLASGLYLYNVTVGNQTVMKKLAIIR